MQQLESFNDLVTAQVRNVFEKVMVDEVNRIEASMMERLKKFGDEQRSKARESANKMTLEVLRKMDVNEVSITFRP